MDKKTLMTSRDRHQDWLVVQPGFSGSGLTQTEGLEWVLVVYSDQMSAETKRAIRNRILAELQGQIDNGEDEVVRFEDIGEPFRALTDDNS